MDPMFQFQYLSMIPGQTSSQTSAGLASRTAAWESSKGKGMNWSPKWRSLGRSLKTPPKRSLGRTWYRKLISKDSSNHWSCGDRVWRCSDIANVSIWPTFLVFCSCVHVMDNGFSLKLMIGCLYALLHLNEIWLFLPAVTLVLTCCDMVTWYYINISICSWTMISCMLFSPLSLGRWGANNANQIWRQNSGSAGAPTHCCQEGPCCAVL